LLNPNNVKPLVFDKGIFDEIESVLQEDSEDSEFSELATCTENLVLVVNHRVEKN